MGAARREQVNDGGYTTLLKMHKAQIRIATTSDASLLAQLRLDLRGRPTNVESDAAFLERCTSWMEHALGQDNWRSWVAELNGELMAALWLQLIEKIPNPTSEPEFFAYITNFYVIESERGKGLGSQMLLEVLSWCRAEESDNKPLISSVILWPSDRSRPLYLRNGFEVSNDLLELEMP